MATHRVEMVCYVEASEDASEDDLFGLAYDQIADDSPDEIHYGPSPVIEVADELRALIQSGRVVAHPGKLLDLAKRLESIR